MSCHDNSSAIHTFLSCWVLLPCALCALLKIYNASEDESEHMLFLVGFKEKLQKRKEPTISTIPRGPRGNVILQGARFLQSARAHAIENPAKRARSGHLASLKA